MSYDIIEMIFKDVIREKNMQQNQVKIVMFQGKTSQCFGNVQILNEKDKDDPTLPSYHCISNFNTRICCSRCHFQKKKNKDSMTITEDLIER